ncbi:MAG: leucyl aminopeptidase [Bacteroidota bacterium]
MKFHFQTTFQPTADSSIIVPVLQENGKAKAATIVQLASISGQNADQLHELFQAKPGEFFPLLSPQGTYLLLGLGAEPSFWKVFKACQKIAAKQAALFAAQTGICWLCDNKHTEAVRLTEAMINGFLLGAYHQGRFKTKQPNTHALLKPESSCTICISELQLEAAKQAVNKAEVICQAQVEIMTLVNAPANHKHPHDIAKWAAESAKKYGFRAEVWDKERITKEGMHGLLAVNQGSAEPPAFIILEYQGQATNGHLPKIGLVGKGVTFDTGGLSIKPSGNMHYMKSDMGGAAAVLGTMEVAARMKLPIHLVGVVPSTDNSVDANAVKPSDVISSYSGKTIEIIDTDAEGRLILADGLSYMVRQHQPQVLIDLATLTGSSVRALGYEAAALFSNDDQLAHHLEMAGQKTGERVWRLPLWEEYGDQMKSDVADIKNFSGLPIAGAISAAKFLEFFTDEHPSWAHLDIAGVAFGDVPYSGGKAATGYGIRLLIEFMEGLKV